MESGNNPPQRYEDRVEEVFSTRFDTLARKTDRLFGYLFIFQWALGIFFAVFISPRTWIGDLSEIHFHVYAAVFLGSWIAALPIYLVFTQPGAVINRMVIGVSQILFSVLFIHLTGGRIETHFHVFGSLAFLAIYRDWRVVLIGTLVTAIDHLVRGALWPLSTYGVLTATPWRAIEHAAWVVFEDSILLYSIKLSLGELRSVSESQVRLEDQSEALKQANEAIIALNISLEEKVRVRTLELQHSQDVIVNQQQSILSSAKMSALGEMAGGVAHEINNPLAAIKCISEQLQEVVDDEPMDKALLKDMAAQVEKTTNRIAKIVQGLRSFSRDGSKDQFQTVNVSELIEETLSFCKERFRVGGTQITVENINPDTCFEGRATEVSQVLLNLLNNSHDAISGITQKWIKVSVLEKPEFLEIQVTDCGTGISASVREKIFQPFFTTKDIGKGTGMGLSISSGIIRGHNGELKLDSDCPNTRFIIRLPKKQLPASAA